MGQAPKQLKCSKSKDMSGKERCSDFWPSAELEAVIKFI